jgi:hypothetical protein
MRHRVRVRLLRRICTTTDFLVWCGWGPRASRRRYSPTRGCQPLHFLAAVAQLREHFLRVLANVGRVPGGQWRGGDSPWRGGGRSWSCNVRSAVEASGWCHHLYKSKISVVSAHDITIRGYMPTHRAGRVANVSVTTRRCTRYICHTALLQPVLTRLSSYGARDLLKQPFLVCCCNQRPRRTRGVLEYIGAGGPTRQQ